MAAHGRMQPRWTHMAAYGNIWPHMAAYDRIWLHVAAHGRIELQDHKSPQLNVPVARPTVGHTWPHTAAYGRR